MTCCLREGVQWYRATDRTIVPGSLVGPFSFKGPNEELNRIQLFVVKAGATLGDRTDAWRIWTSEGIYTERVRPLADVFRALNRLRDERIVVDYAIGGATAVLFYAEPTRTYDIDVFVRLQGQDTTSLQSLSAVYSWADAQGVVVDAEHLMIAGVPVQVLPAFNALVEEAIAEARVHDYDGVPVRVVGPEHLVALALQAGGARRRERAWQLLESGTVDRERLKRLLAAHGIAVEVPDDV